MLTVSSRAPLVWLHVSAAGATTVLLSGLGLERTSSCGQMSAGRCHWLSNLPDMRLLSVVQ
jgi:hypothetical protein